jgi:thiamine biosynthesis lipoprotein
MFKEMNEFSQYERLMGSQFELRILCRNASEAVNYLGKAIAEIRRIEKLISEFDQDSFTAQINRNAGVKPAKVNAEVYELITRSIQLSQLTQGAFEITAGVLKKLYQFNNTEFHFPSQEAINETLDKVGFKKIHLNKNNEVFLAEKGMHISFAAIGKGYAADCAARLMKLNNVQSGVINASGDLTVWGRKKDGSPWKVGIADPENPSAVCCWIPLENASVATSGGYYQHFIYNAVKYSHNIDPKSGIPVAGLKSVTIISNSAELCDALATAVYVMGKNTGMHFINQLPSVHCIIIDENNNILFSNNLNFKHHAITPERQIG